MTRYERVIEILNSSIGGPEEEIGVHGTFWRGLTRDQFVAKRVRGLNIIALGDGANLLEFAHARGDRDDQADTSGVSTGDDRVKFVDEVGKV